MHIRACKKPFEMGSIDLQEFHRQVGCRCFVAGGETSLSHFLCKTKHTFSAVSDCWDLLLGTVCLIALAQRVQFAKPAPCRFWKSFSASYRRIRVAWVEQKRESDPNEFKKRLKNLLQKTKMGR